MNNANNTYLNVTMATHAGRNILFGIGKERAIYYAVQRADVKVETTGFRLRKLDIDALKQQGVDVGDKLNPLLGKLIATEAVYIEELKKLLKTDVVEKHKTKLLAAARQTKTVSWHDWQLLQLPQEKADESVTSREKSDGTGSLIASVYNSHKDSAGAGVQAVSVGERLHVFRQSIRGTLLVDRFVLDIETNQLNRAIEVRFRRSRKRYEPLSSSNNKVLDSCDFRDADGKFFLAPSLELRMIQNLSDGLFTVVIVPTMDSERGRWHIFAWDAKQKCFRVTSLRSQTDGGFDLYDHTVVEGAAARAKYRQIAGLIRTNLTLRTGAQVLSPSAPPSATNYDTQREVEGNDGEKRVLRVARRVMLTVPTGSDGKVATVTFSVKTDGTLARVATTPVDKLLSEKNETVLLPADLLDRVNTRSANTLEPAPEVRRQGLYFAADGSCRAVTATAIELKNRSFTVEFWARRSGEVRNSYILRQGTDGTRTCLHIGFRVSNKFTFAFYGDDLDTQAGQDDKDWHHWSCTYDASSRLRCIYRDGTKIASDKAAGPYLGEGELTIGRSDHHYFDGDLADLRIWSCARTEAEVKANLNARLSGREFELMASWPLLSVEEDRTRNRVAQGPEIKTQGLYSSRRTLHRLLKDGNTPAVNFESRTFVAAVERSTYSETLEFKGDASGIEFLYWGKAIGGAQSTKVPVKATVVALDNGWKRASARFTAPRGFTHLRAFDMRVLGVWTKLMVRNHKLQRLQSTVTERTYTETLTLPVVAADHAAKERGRQALSRDEREIARLRKEHAIREAALARSPEQNTQVIDNKRKQVTALETKVTAVTAHRSLMERHLTYGGALAIRGNNGKNNRYLTVEGTSVRCNRSIVGGAEKFVIHDAQNPSSEDVVRYGDWVGLRGYTGKYLIAANPSWPHSHYYWVGAEWPHIKNYEKFTLLNPNDLNDRSPIYASGAIALMTNRRDHGQKFVRTSTGGAWWERVWCEGSSIEPGTRWAAHRLADGPGVAKARSNEAADRLKLSNARAELVNLEKVAADATNRRQELTAERDSYANQLKSAEAKLAQTKAKIGGQGVASYSMTTLTPNGRADTVTGSLLGFARTSVRPQVRESMLGSVRLRFPGVNGRLRVCSYDTMTEKWQSGDHASCMRNQTGYAGIPFNSRYQLTTMTVEVWFKWEGKSTDAGFLLGRGLEEIEIHTAGAGVPGSLRFIPVPGVYIDTEANAVTPGVWTHVACVYRGHVSSAEIYINGVVATASRHDGKKKQPSTTESIAVGCRNGGSHKFRGQMQQLRLWNVALSTDEIVANMHFELSGHEPGLVGYWPLTEGSGTVAHDRSPTANHAKLHGVEFYPTQTPMGRLPAKAVTFTQNGYVNGIENINIANKSFTVEFWARSEAALGRTQGLFLQGPPKSDECLHLVFMPGNKFSFRFYGNDLDVQQATDTGWHHWACVYDAGSKKRKIYCDGVVVAEDVSPRHYRGSGPISIGAYHGHRGLAGQMSDVRCWNQVRSQAQIQGHMYSRLRGDEAGLIGYWTLDGIVDGKVRGKDGALVGSVADASETIHDDLPLCPADAFVGGEYDSVEQVAGKKVAYLRRMQAWSTGSEITYGMGQRVDTLEMRWLGNAQMKPTLVGYIEGAPPVPSENLTVEADYRGASSVEFKVSESAARTYEQTLSTGVDMKLGVEVGAATNTGGGVAFGLNAFEEANTKALVQGHLDASARFQSDFSHGDVRASTTSDKLSLTGAREKKAEYPRLGLRYEPKNVGYATVVSTLADVYALRLKSSKRMVSYRVVPVKDIPPDINTVTFLINPAYTKNGSLDGQVGSESATGDVFSHVAKARAQYGSAVESSYFRVREAYSLRDEIERSNRNNEARVINKKTGLIGQSKQDATVSTENSSGEKQQQQVASKAGEGLADIKEQQGKLGKDKRPSIDKLIAKIPKSNIVNSYVWDGDGGLRSQTQSYATWWKTVYGGSFSVDVGAGVKLGWMGFGLGVNFDFMLSGHFSMSFTDTKEHSRAIELNVELKCENRDITDNRDRPLHPGEKVDRYRFMSFALQASTHHFNDFFDRVVDPVWLRSSDEEAVLLRQLDRGKPNQAWRVLHRVTYVERPAAGSK